MNEEMERIRQFLAVADSAIEQDFHFDSAMAKEAAYIIRALQARARVGKGEVGDSGEIVLGRLGLPCWKQPDGVHRPVLGAEVELINSALAALSAKPVEVGALAKIISGAPFPSTKSIGKAQAILARYNVTEKE